MHSVLSYQPQLLTGSNTVLPDTLKVPIVPSIIVPTLATVPPQYIKEPINNPNTQPSVMSMQTQNQLQTPISNVINTPRENASKGTSTLNPKTQTQMQMQISTATTKCTSNIAPDSHNTSTHTNTNTTSTSTMAGTVATISTTSVTPTLSVRHCTQAPKSPPRWPLRPGVMVHVSSDTKENLAVNRMTLKPNATLANLTASTVNDSSVSSSTLNNSASNTTQTTSLNVTATNTSALLQNSHSQVIQTLSRMGRQQGRILNSNKVEEEMGNLTNNNNNNNNNTNVKSGTEALGNINSTTGTSTSTNTGTKVMMMSEEISSDLQTEMRNIENVMTSQANTTVAEEEQANEIQRLTGGVEGGVQEKEIRVEVTTSQEETAQQGQNAETMKMGKKSRLDRVEDFFVSIFFKRRSSPTSTCRDSQRSHVGLLGGKFWKRSENNGAAVSNTADPFATEHRLKGIRSSGSVTYKKCAKTSTSATNRNSSIVTSTSSSCSRANETCNTTIQSSCQTNTNLINTPVITRTLTISQQQKPQPQQQPSTGPAAPHHQVPTNSHPLPQSVISMGPSSNTNHPAISGDPKNAHNISNVTTNDAMSNRPINVTPSTASNVTANRPSDSNSQNSSMRSIRKGILKAPTPPPRPPPPPLKRPPPPSTTLHQKRVQRSSSLVCPMPKVERVQIILNASSCEVLI
ncbi:uncharacterized protein LOC142233241 [Haematobia irritans]|uniref:uncharacterized protein LOC142233241 n=1 Tax=Haematobia irritans TaxID=7368 RepID=UPI003F4FB6E7